MSSEHAEKPADSSTPTPSLEAQRAETDAEVIEEAKPKVEPKKAKRVADVSPVNVADIFGEPVEDSAAAKKRGPKAEGEEAPKRRKKKAEPEPVVVTDEHEAQARGLLLVVDGVGRSLVAGRYGSLLTPESAAQLDERMRLGEAELAALTPSLARGLAENDVELPWWAQFALAAGGLAVPRVAILMELERTRKAHVDEASPKPEAKP